MKRGPVSLPAYYRLLKGNANFRRLWLAQVISEMGDWLYSLAVYSMMLEKTGTAQSVALAIVLQLLPQFFLGPFAGAVNDRVSRRQVMIVTDLLRAAVVATMWWADRISSLPLMYLLLLTETSLVAFFEPGRTAVLPNVARNEEETVVGNSLSGTTWSVALAIGSAVGGWVGVMAGRPVLFAINTATFLVSAWLTVRISVTEPHMEGQPPLSWSDLNIMHQVREGWDYIRSDGRLFATILAKAGMGALGIHWVILPIFGERVFPIYRPGYDAARAGLLGMSVFMTVRGIGALIGPLVAGAWAGADQRRMRQCILGAFGMLFVGYNLLGLSPSLLAACAAVLLLQSGNAIVWVFSTTLLQLQSEDRFRGRVFAADFGLQVLMMSTATYITGMLVDGGVRPQTVAMAVGLLAILPGLGWLRAQRLWS